MAPNIRARTPPPPAASSRTTNSTANRPCSDEVTPFPAPLPGRAFVSCASRAQEKERGEAIPSGLQPLQPLHIPVCVGLRRIPITSPNVGGGFLISRRGMYGTNSRIRLVLVRSQPRRAIERATRHLGGNRELLPGLPVVMLDRPCHHIVEDVARAGNTDHVPQIGRIRIACPDA